MSYLNQLRTKASELQVQQGREREDLALNTSLAAAKCKTIWLYLSDLAKQLNVLAPDAPRLLRPKLPLRGWMSWPS